MSMTEKTIQLNRRHEPRYYSSERITWKKTGEAAPFWGYVNDRSRSSVSFVAATENKPAIEQEVEIIGPDLSQEHCRVMRIARYDDNVSLIACRRIDWHNS